jgi:CelD/BcsL family acetyltransferase involved in cellulose biosynthesis
MVVTRAAPLMAFRIAEPPLDVGHSAIARLLDLSREFADHIIVDIYKNLAAVETEWRQFQAIAACTPFQTFEWLSAWQRNVGAREGTVPVIAVARFVDGKIACIMPLALEARRLARRLRWLGQDLCDYNAPLLARGFSERITPSRFLAVWAELCRRMQADPDITPDWIEFEKMPETVGVEINPFTHLRTMPNADSAYITQLGGDWDSFYLAKRSSATRRHDRAKRKHMERYGKISFTTALKPVDIARTFETLWEQKKRIFARKGITDLFARPGYRQFFVDFATNPQTRHLAHVSRVEVGDTHAAANFAIVFGDCYYHVLSSYCDGRLTRYGPGTLHLRELLAHATKLGLRRFDFTVGDERYKLEWSDLCLKLYDYSTAASWRGWPLSSWSAAQRWLKRFVKQTPVIWNLVCRIRSAVGPF